MHPIYHALVSSKYLILHGVLAQAAYSSAKSEQPRPIHDRRPSWMSKRVRDLQTLRIRDDSPGRWRSVGALHGLEDELDDLVRLDEALAPLLVPLGREVLLLNRLERLARVDLFLHARADRGQHVAPALEISLDRDLAVAGDDLERVVDHPQHLVGNRDKAVDVTARAEIDGRV